LYSVMFRCIIYFLLAPQVGLKCTFHLSYSWSHCNSVCFICSENKISKSVNIVFVWKVIL
jgi:hypothetical protein